MGEVVQVDVRGRSKGCQCSLFSRPSNRGMISDRPVSSGCVSVRSKGCVAVPVLFLAMSQVYPYQVGV